MLASLVQGCTPLISGRVCVHGKSTRAWMKEVPGICSYPGHNTNVLHKTDQRPDHQTRLITTNSMQELQISKCQRTPMTNKTATTTDREWTTKFVHTASSMPILIICYFVDEFGVGKIRPYPLSKSNRRVVDLSKPLTPPCYRRQPRRKGKSICPVDLPDKNVATYNCNEWISFEISPLKRWTCRVIFNFQKEVLSSFNSLKESKSTEFAALFSIFKKSFFRALKELKSTLSLEMDRKLLCLTFRYV
jgi:hypothetical protein